MQIQVRVRTNKVRSERKDNQLVHNGFVLFADCDAVKYGAPQIKSRDKFEVITHQSLAAKSLPVSCPETGEKLVCHFMVKDTNVCPTDEVYDFNVIEWTDRNTGKRHRLVYDTVAWLMDDKGDTIRKLESEVPDKKKVEALELQGIPIPLALKEKVRADEVRRRSLQMEKDLASTVMTNTPNVA